MKRLPPPISRPELLRPGARLCGRYCVQRTLGQGGQCYVYLARDHARDGETVVIKNMINHSPDPEIRREEWTLFSQEASILGEVRHPGLPSLVEAFSEGDAHFVVEEYVGNVDMERLLEMRGGRLAEAEVAWIAHHMLDMLTYLHTLPRPVVLRDIKPSNITCTIDARGRIEPASRAWFVDLTIATRYDGVGRDERRMGSVGYSPPEQYRGRSQPGSDLYALGVTLHRALTGHDPVVTPFALPAVETLAPGIRHEWAAFFRTATALAVGSRFSSALEMRRDLEAFFPREDAERRVRALATVSRPLPWPGWVGVRTWSRARVAAVLLLALLAIAGVLGAVAILAPRSTPRGSSLEAKSNAGARALLMTSTGGAT